MSFIVKTLFLSDAKKINKLYNSYYKYLETVKKKMPKKALRFALAKWHYDIQDHRCPHDSWLESLAITEPSFGKRHQERHIEIRMKLLGAYHDGYIELKYKKVSRYELGKDKDKKKHGKAGASHGEWIIDEIRLSGSNKVIHDIYFSNSSHWLIECDDLIYRWIPFKDEGE